MAYRSSSINNGTVTTLPTVTVPAGVASGDIIIIAKTGDTTVADTIVPTGFAALGTAGTLTFDGEYSILYWKRATGADTGSYAQTSTAWASGVTWIMAAVAFSGRHATNNPVASTLAQSNTGNASPVTATSGSVTVIAGDDLCGALVDDPTGTTTASAAQGSFTMRQSRNAAFQALAVETWDNATTGAQTAAVQFTAGSTSGWQGWVVRIPSSAVAGGPPVSVLRPRILAPLNSPISSRASFT